MGMGAYLGVAQGADYAGLGRPKFIHMTYTPPGGASRKVALVGKGLTFDSGGYNIKAGAGSMIEKMKFDSAHAARPPRARRARRAHAARTPRARRAHVTRSRNAALHRTRRAARERTPSASTRARRVARELLCVRQWAARPLCSALHGPSAASSQRASRCTLWWPRARTWCPTRRCAPATS